jgi:serine protease Do
MLARKLSTIAPTLTLALSRSLGLSLGLSLSLSLGLAGCASSPTTGPGGPIVNTATAPSLQVSDQAGLPTESTMADLVARLSPMVVNITTVQRAVAHSSPHPFDFFFPDGPPVPRERQGAGTGFVIDGTEGYVVTNAHVVRGADEVEVRLRDDRVFGAVVVGRDRKLDLALLQLSGEVPLDAVTLGSSRSLRVGEQVLAVGNPFGLGHTVTMGIVSAKARSIGAGPYDNFIQTDASINPGNSGGPLFNLRGEVIGINTAIRAGADGIGFAIPIDVLKDIIPQLVDKGFVERGKLGLMFQPVTPEIAAAVGLDRPWGAMVSEVMPGSAAARAGIQSGDVITAVQGEDIHRAIELPRNVARHAPGSTIQVAVLRDGKRLDVKATLDKLEEDKAKPPTRKAPASKPPSRKVQGIDVEDAKGLGARVTKTDGSVKGLMPGDLIVAVGGETVRTAAELHERLAAAKGKEAVLAQIRRGDHRRYVGIPITP